MEPDFGVGLNRYLFSNFDGGTYTVIDSKIREQVDKYLPIIRVNKISFDAQGQDVNKLGISLAYSIPNIGVRDLLEFTI